MKTIKISKNLVGTKLVYKPSNKNIKLKHFIKNAKNNVVMEDIKNYGIKVK